LGICEISKGLIDLPEWREDRSLGDLVSECHPDPSRGDLVSGQQKVDHQNEG
jgi:hypothetical protein